MKTKIFVAFMCLLCCLSSCSNESVEERINRYRNEGKIIIENLDENAAASCIVYKDKGHFFLDDMETVKDITPEGELTPYAPALYFTRVKVEAKKEANFGKTSYAEDFFTPFMSHLPNSIINEVKAIGKKGLLFTLSNDMMGGNDSYHIIYLFNNPSEIYTAGYFDVQYRPDLERVEYVDTRPQITSIERFIGYVEVQARFGLNVSTGEFIGTALAVDNNVCAFSGEDFWRTYESALMARGIDLDQYNLR